MSSTVVFCALLAFASQAYSYSLSGLDSSAALEGHVQSMQIQSLLSRQPGSLNDFKFKNCGKKGDLALIKNISVTPQILGAGMNVSVAFDGEVYTTLDSQLSLNLTIKLGLYGKWIKVPCEFGYVGSCFYPEICDYLSGIEECPGFLSKHGIPCKCPFKKGQYHLPREYFYLDEGLPSGDYYLRVEFAMDRKPAACAEIYLTFV